MIAEFLGRWEESRNRNESNTRKGMYSIFETVVTSRPDDIVEQYQI